MINFAFIFHRGDVFGFLCGVMAKFELVTPKFQNYTTLHVYLWGFQISHFLKKSITYQRKGASGNVMVNKLD